MSQEQVRQAFGYKWTRNPDWGITGKTSEIVAPWVLEMLGFKNLDCYRQYLRTRLTILDAGCGNGRETLLAARLNPEATVIGMDISEAIQAARANTQGLDNVRLLQGDVCNPPFPSESFDYIVSLGVLHHTPNTFVGLKALTRLLKPGGEIAFMVYRRKAPIREFADDFIREAIQHMTPEEAWREMESITRLGKALSDLKAEIEIPEIKVLGMQGGRHDVQRLIYYTVLKCYWRDAFTFEENVHVNFDWYYPKFAWRHTTEEVRDWFLQLGLEETHCFEMPANLTFRARRR